MRFQRVTWEYSLAVFINVKKFCNERRHFENSCDRFTRKNHETQFYGYRKQNHNI